MRFVKIHQRLIDQTPDPIRRRIGSEAGIERDRRGSQTKPYRLRIAPPTATKNGEGENKDTGQANAYRILQWIQHVMYAETYP